MVSFTSNHFWSGITWTSTCGFQSISIIVHVRKTEVNDLDVVLIIQQKILGLKVSMTNADFVDVFYTRHYLLEKPACFILLQSFPLDDVVEQFGRQC